MKASIADQSRKNSYRSGRGGVAPLLAGLAEVDITPPLDLMIAGSFFPRPIEGVLDPLFARSLVLRAGNAELAIVSCDLLIFGREMVTEVRRRIESEARIRAGNVALVATHNHTGPYTRRNFGTNANDDYVRWLEDRIVESVRLARLAVEPGELGVGCAFEGGISFNRRYVMKDGLVRTHPPRASTELSHAEGPIDPEVGVIGLRRAGGEMAGCFVNFACHPNVVRGNRISADYPGALSRALKRAEGAQFVTIFGNGACGNLCQIDVHDAEKNFNGRDWADHMGETLAQKVTQASDRMTFTPEAFLGARSRTVEVALRHPDRTAYHGTMFAGDTIKEVDQCYLEQRNELLQFIDSSPFVGIEIQVLRIGPAALVMLPVELFVEHGLELKLRSPIKPTFVVGHANGSYGYVPTRYAFDRGGYEVRTCMNSMLVPEAGDQIIAASLEVLSELVMEVS